MLGYQGDTQQQIFLLTRILYCRTKIKGTRRTCSNLPLLKDTNHFIQNNPHRMVLVSDHIWNIYLKTWYMVSTHDFHQQTLGICFLVCLSFFTPVQLLQLSSHCILHIIYYVNDTKKTSDRGIFL